MEATFQLQWSKILDDLLQLQTYETDERFQISLEKNMPVYGNKDYIDIVVKHTKKSMERLYLIELKFKKISDSASDSGNIVSFIDMCNLDYHQINTPKVYGCYFIFLTDYENYTKTPKPSSTRGQLPMHDGAVISLACLTPNYASNMPVYHFYIMACLLR